MKFCFECKTPILRARDVPENSTDSHCSVLDDDAGSARDSPGGGGKGKETRRYKATRMTAAASKYISCVY